MSTSPLAVRECWIYDECSMIWMTVAGAPAPGEFGELSIHRSSYGAIGASEN